MATRGPAGKFPRRFLRPYITQPKHIPSTHHSIESHTQSTHKAQAHTHTHTLMSSATINNIFRRMWNSPTGPKTVHFWAPTLKWGLVFAGASDFKRPVEKVSGAQNLSLLATAVIWTRWSFVIRPKNMLLASVNFFLGVTAGWQLGRIVKYRLSQGDSPVQVVKYVVNGEKKVVGEPEVKAATRASASV